MTPATMGQILTLLTMRSMWNAGRGLPGKVPRAVTTTECETRRGRREPATQLRTATASRRNTGEETPTMVPLLLLRARNWTRKDAPRMLLLMGLTSSTLPLLLPLAGADCVQSHRRLLTLAARRRGEQHTWFRPSLAYCLAPGAQATRQLARRILHDRQGAQTPEQAFKIVGFSR